MVSEVLPDRRRGAWEKGEIVRLRSESRDFKDFVEKKFAPHGLSGLVTLHFHFLHCSVGNLVRFVVLLFTKAW